MVQISSRLEDTHLDEQVTVRGAALLGGNGKNYTQ